MKEINQMTNQEIEMEIKNFILNKFDSNKAYIFVSYSHKDKTEVMKKVLEWIRLGYNVIMDLDFENHGSEESWIDLLCKRIRSDRCVQVACFRSKHYYRSIACLIELLLLRSSYIENKRHSPKYKVIPMDIIELSPKKIVDEDPEFEKEYEILFSKTPKKIDTKEYDMLEKGLETLCEKKRYRKGDANKEGKTTKDDVQEYIDNLNESMEDGALDYYSYIQSLFDEWFEYNDMNGNYKDMSYDASAVFDSHEVHKFSNEQSRQTDEVMGDDLEENSESIKEELLNENDKAVENTKEDSSSNKKAFSITGDISYELYGQKYTGNQSEFMIQVFGSILKKHQDVIDDAIETFTCLSSVDYTKKENKTNEMKSYFRVCYTAKFGEKQVCIGTAYNISSKLSLIANLLDFVGEDRSVLKIEGMDLPIIKHNESKKSSSSDPSGKEKYIVDGVQKEGTQADMMFDVFERLAEKCPDKINKLISLTSVKPVSDVSYPGTPDAKPTYFRICREYEAMGVQYYVGASYGKKDKLKQIQKMIKLCGENDKFFECEGEESLTSAKSKEKVFNF